MLGAFGPVSGGPVDGFIFPFPALPVASLGVPPTHVNLWIVAPYMDLWAATPVVELHINEPS